MLDTLRSLAIAAPFIACLLAAPAARAQVSGEVVRIGFVTDLTGPYAGVDGPAGAEAVRMAVADIGGAVAGKRVEVLVADHRNNPDVAAATAREWSDAHGLDALIGGVNSSSTLAMARVAQEKQKPFLVVGAGNSAHTNEQCSPYTVQYAYDTAAFGKVAGAGVAKAGGGSWYFLTADVPFYGQIEDGAKAGLRAAGGSVEGSARHPFSTGNFLPLLPAARIGGAQVLGLGNGHTDTINVAAPPTSSGSRRP